LILSQFKLLENKKFVKILKTMKTTILLPLYNDWISLNKLLGKNFFLKNKKKFNVIIINDNSYIKKKFIKNLKNFNKVIIINLKNNLGSQRAIIIGLSYLKKINL